MGSGGYSEEVGATVDGYSEDAPRIEKEQTVTTWERPQQRKKECYKVLWQRKA